MAGPGHSGAKRRCQSGAAMTPNGQKVDHSGSTLQRLFELYRQAELCDVQLQVGGHLFPAHKLILSMSSDVFKTMLTDAKWPDARKACIVLNEEPECVQVFGEFLQYMYTGSIHLSNSSVLPVLTLADKYNIHDLGKVCKQYMASHCHTSLPNLKVVSWLQYAILCNDKDLERTLRRYVVLNLNHVMQSEDFLTMRQETLGEVLTCRHLVIHSEYTLFLGIKRWLLHNTGTMAGCDQGKARDGVEHTSDSQHQQQHHAITGQPDRTHLKPSKTRRAAEKSKTLQLMSHIRFPLMKHSQLMILQSDPFVQQHAHFFQPKLQAALSASMYPHCTERRALCEAVHTTTADSRHVHGQSSKLCRTVVHRVCSGSRSVLRRNSDPSRVHGCSGKSDVRPHTPTGECRDSDMVSSASGPTVLSTPGHSPDSERSVSPQGMMLLSVPCATPLPSPLSSVMPVSGRGGSVCCLPRNYTCDDWSTCLAIEGFAEFPRYGSHTYFFSTPSSAVPLSSSSGDRCNVDSEAEETDDGAMLEWQAELYPKGVHFPRAKMIGIPNNYDIDENCQEVVRLAVNSKTQHEHPCRVDITVLTVALGKEDGSEYMETLAHKNCIFDKEHTMHNIDNILSLDELSQLQSKYLTESVRAPGSGRTCFKLVVIIKPAA